MTLDPLERAWAKHLEMVALMTPGLDVDVDPFELAERIPPEPPPPPPARTCITCRGEFHGDAWRGMCRRCYDTERRAR